MSRVDLAITLAFVVALAVVQLLQRGRRLRTVISRQSAWIRWSLYYGVVLAIVLFGRFDEPQAFIYFQF